MLKTSLTHPELLPLPDSQAAAVQTIASFQKFVSPLGVPPSGGK